MKKAPAGPNAGGSVPNVRAPTEHENGDVVVAVQENNLAPAAVGRVSEQTINESPELRSWARKYRGTGLCHHAGY